MDRAGKNYNICLFGAPIEDPGLGDIAIVRETLRALKTEIQNVTFTLFADNPALAQGIFGAKAVSNAINQWRSQLRSIRQADLLVAVGGGSVFSSNTLTRILQITLAKLLSKRIMFYAISYEAPKPRKGSLRSILSWLANRLIISWTDVITVREELSMYSLRKLKRRDKLFLTSDPAINIEAEVHQQLAHAAFRTEFKDTAFVSVCPRHLVYRVWHPYSKEIIENYKDTLTKVADFIATEVAQVLFVPFNTVPPDNDLETINYIITHMRKKDRIEVVDIGGYSPQEVAGLVRQSELLLGVRLHSLIFAAPACIPMVAISYEPKVYGFMKLMGQENLVCQVVNFTYEDCVSKIEYAYTHRELVKQQMEPRVKELKDKAALNARLAKELLMKRKFITQGDD